MTVALLPRPWRSRRLRWLALGALARLLVRRGAARQVERATAEVEERLPAPVARVLDAAPGDLIRAGGSAVVAGRTARRMASGTRRAGRSVGDQRRTVGDAVSRVRGLGHEIGRERDRARRELTARYLRATGDHRAADDVLIDLRDPIQDHEEPLPSLDPPIPTGRKRADRRLGTAVVNRVQRTYRPRPKPWDR